MKVYVVTQGTYSDYGLVGIFSTKEKAMEFLEKQGRWDYDLNSSENDIEEYELDGLHYNQFVCVKWYVGGRCYFYETEGEFPDRYIASGWDGKETFEFCLPVDHRAFLHNSYAERQKHCEKIAQDRYAKFKAERAGL